MKPPLTSGRTPPAWPALFQHRRASCCGAFWLAGVARLRFHEYLGAYRDAVTEKAFACGCGPGRNG